MKAILSLCLVVGVLADNSTTLSSSGSPLSAAPRMGAAVMDVPTTLIPITTTPPPPAPTTVPATELFCPAGWCHDTMWFPGSPCITPDPTVLGPCWDSYCKANVAFPTVVPTGGIIIDPGQDKGSYCKSWQIPAGRVCYGNDTVTCECDSFKSTSPVTAIPGYQPSGWLPAVNCSYPQPTTTTIAPSWNPYDPDNDNGQGTSPGVPPQPSSFASHLVDGSSLVITLLSSLSILAVVLY